MGVRVTAGSHWSEPMRLEQVINTIRELVALACLVVYGLMYPAPKGVFAAVVVELEANGTAVNNILGCGRS